MNNIRKIEKIPVPGKNGLYTIKIKPSETRRVMSISEISRVLREPVKQKPLINYIGREIMNRIIEKRLLSAREAGQYLGVKRTTIYDLMNKGKLKSVKIGKRRLFDIHDLDEFVEQLKKSQ